MLESLQNLFIKNVALDEKNIRIKIVFCTDGYKSLKIRTCIISGRKINFNII